MAKEFVETTFEAVVLNPVTVNTDLIQMQQILSNDDYFNSVAELFKVLGDPTRAKIIHCLQNSELCVCDIAEMLNMTHSAVSHQLRVLRASRLVKYRREGRMVYYSLNDQHVASLMKEASEHVSE
jgi:ArsR family transcriptional regulator, lead/cadmium/zinc/bismuth-responsive transcriptional repressor